MTVDWSAFSTIATAVLAAAVGAWINKLLTDRPKLITHYGHVAAFNVGQDSAEPLKVHTHAVVIKNIGRKTATNIRVGHNYLPDMQVFPDVNYTINQLPQGGKEIIFPTLVPKEEIHINYLYFPPVVFSNINTYVKSDQGSAKRINVLLTPIQPQWLVSIVLTLVLSGIIGITYLLVAGFDWIASMTK